MPKQTKKTTSKTNVKTLVSKMVDMKLNKRVETKRLMLTANKISLNANELNPVSLFDIAAGNGNT